MNEFSTIIRQQAKTISIELSESQINVFKAFYEDLVEKNKVMNLTAITDMHEVINKHFIDSLMPWKYIDRRSDEVKDSYKSGNTDKPENTDKPKDIDKSKSDINKVRICDIGTGAGFPGVPLAIVLPQIEFTLIDSLNKRINFINEEAEKLELHNVRGVHGRSEDLAHDINYRERFDIVVSRAVANLSTLSEYALPFVKVGGVFIAYKSVDTDDEIKESKKAISTLGGEIKNIEDMKLPETDIPRRIVVIEKKSETPKKYPRQAGTPSKKPIH